MGVERYLPAPRGFFLFIDSFDSHEPWDPPATYVARGDDADRLRTPITEDAGTDDLPRCA